MFPKPGQRGQHVLSMWEGKGQHLLEHEWPRWESQCRGTATGDGGTVMRFSWPQAEEGHLG